jgi:Fur family transcriptional regulator, ferric uptake regulator
MCPSTPASLKALLNQRGFRLTPQRQTILHIFQTLPQGNHLSAEDLYQILRQQGERISLSTVYRTLHVMAFMGILRELELAEGHKHYELNSGDSSQHHHLVCVQCNRTLEFESDLIDRIGIRQAQAEGYHLLDCQLTVYSVCPEAMQQGWNRTLPKDWVCERAMRHQVDETVE